MEQTAVEWFVHQIGPFLEMDKEEAIKVIEQAKAMEKEQIIEAAGRSCQYMCYNDRRSAEEYYNETYNK